MAGRVWQVAFSPDGHYVAGYPEETTICVWVAEAGLFELRLQGHVGAYRVFTGWAAAFIWICGHDGAHIGLAHWYRDGRTIVWPYGLCRLRLLLCRRAVHCVAVVRQDNNGVERR